MFEPVSTADRNLIRQAWFCFLNAVFWLTVCCTDWWKYVCTNMMHRHHICVSDLKSVHKRPAGVHYREHCHLLSTSCHTDLCVEHIVLQIFTLVQHFMSLTHPCRTPQRPPLWSWPPPPHSCARTCCPGCQCAGFWTVEAWKRSDKVRKMWWQRSMKSGDDLRAMRQKWWCKVLWSVIAS